MSQRATQTHTHPLCVCSSCGPLTSHDCVIGLSWLLAAPQLQLTVKPACKGQAGASTKSSESRPLQDTRLLERKADLEKRVTGVRCVWAEWWQTESISGNHWKQEGRGAGKTGCVCRRGRRDALWQESLADTVGLPVTPLYTGNRHKQGCRCCRRLHPL